MAKRFSSEQKAAVLKEIKSLQDDGHSIKEACKRAKISLPTFYKWKNGPAAERSTKADKGAKQNLDFGSGDGILICGSAAFVQQIATSLGLRR